MGKCEVRIDLGCALTHFSLIRKRYLIKKYLKPCFKICYFCINILKIAVRANRSVIIYQTSAFVILLCWNFTLLLSNFCC